MYLNMQIPFLGLWSQWNLPVGPLMNEGSSRVYPVCSHHTVKALCLQSPSFRSNYTKRRKIRAMTPTKPR